MPTSNRSNHGPGNNWASPGLPRIVLSASSTRNSTCGLASRRIATTSSGDDQPIGTPIAARRRGTGARSRPVRAKADRSSARDPRNALLGNSNVRHSENWSTPKSTMSSTASSCASRPHDARYEAVAHVGLTDEDPAAARDDTMCPRGLPGALWGTMPANGIEDRRRPEARQQRPIEDRHQARVDPDGQLPPRSSRTGTKRCASPGRTVTRTAAIMAAWRATVPSSAPRSRCCRPRVPARSTRQPLADGRSSNRPVWEPARRSRLPVTVASRRRRADQPRPVAIATATIATTRPATARTSTIERFRSGDHLVAS